MLLKLSGYIIFIIIIFKLPEGVFSFLLRKIEEIHLKIKNFFAKFFSQSVRSAGEGLLLSLSEFEGSLSCGLINQEKSIPKFKFYTNLLLKLLATNRQEGIAIRKLIPELRNGVQRDIQFEKKISKVIIGGNFQFAVIALATWGFVFFSQQLVDIKLDTNLGLLMLALQIMGFLFLNLMTSWLKKEKFQPYSSAFEEIYLFKSLIEVRMPIKQILLESNIMNGSLVNSKVFSSIKKRIVYSVERWKTSGISPKDESEELIKEIWYSQEEQFVDFIKKIEILKFIIMALLFLPAYFIYLAAIFKFFMEQ